MSEKLPQPHGESLPKLDTKEVSQKHLDALRERAKAEQDKHQDETAVESLKRDVEQLAISKESYDHTEGANDNAPTATYVSSQLKAMGRQRTLNNVRRQMNAPSRWVSQVIHQPVIEKISDAAAPTLARPSGLLGGGFFALLGTSVLLYITRHYGYRYNYLVFIALFVGGFFAGLLLELLIKLLVRRRQS